MIRTLVATVLFTTAAWAQTDPAAAPATVEAPAATEVAAPATAIPTDPMELVAYALAAARDQRQCRFAFTRLQSTEAQSGWAGDNAEATIRFDPRLPIGERWTVTAERHQRAMQRALARQDRAGLPFDLITIAVQGEWTYENIALKTELPDRYIYSYAPQMIPERSASETGEGIIEQLVGELEVSRADGRVMSTLLREPPEGAVRAMGIVRVHRALLHTAYAPGPEGLLVAETGSQMMAMSALLTQTSVTTQFRFTDIEPICDPAAIAAIEAAEAAARADD